MLLHFRTVNESTVSVPKNRKSKSNTRTTRTSTSNSLTVSFRTLL